MRKCFIIFINFINGVSFKSIPFYIFRGQESAGIVTSDGNPVPTFRTHKVYLNIKKKKMILKITIARC